MIFLMRNMSLDDERVVSFLDCENRSFEHSGLLTSDFMTTSGRLGDSHLICPVTESMSPEEIANAAVENKVIACSDHGGFEFMGSIFAFDLPEGYESRVKVKFSPSLKLIGELPTFKRNLDFLTSDHSDLHFSATCTHSVEQYAAITEIGPNLMLPVILNPAAESTIAFLEIQADEGDSRFGTLHMFGPNSILKKNGVLAQTTNDDSKFVDVGEVERLSD